MRFHTLEEWLRWQERLNPREIDLGLERVRQVWQLLSPELGSTMVITVAGTNGKGSTIALLESILHRAGYRTGSYTSPHLVRYNERIHLQGEPVSDERILEAFEDIDGARGDLPLTYFEFGTLAALWIMAREKVDVALLEVGLGGRLDAVNIVDADLAIITSIDLDHQSWLGEDREAIGREKAGIFRPGRPAVFSAREMPESVALAAVGLGTRLYRNGIDFQVMAEAETWNWQGPQRRFDSLPYPGLAGAHQLDNAAGVLMTLTLLAERVPVSEESVREGLGNAWLPGRIQRLWREGVEWVLDVAHNPHAVESLHEALQERPAGGKTFALLGMLKDKDFPAVIDGLDGQVDEWHYASLEGARGLRADALNSHRAGKTHDSVSEAVRHLQERASRGDRVVVFGSFHTVGQALPLLQEPAHEN